jgi:hypothetical protein
LIEKILDFKSWVVGCLKDDFETLVRHIDMHLFIFLVDSLGWLVMQYKVSPIDHEWNPTNAPPIILWNTNPNGSLKLRMGVPSLVFYHPIWGIDPLRFVERQKFIGAKLSKYVDFWNVGIGQSATYKM